MNPLYIQLLGVVAVILMLGIVGLVAAWRERTHEPTEMTSEEGRRFYTLLREWFDSAVEERTRRERERQPQAH